MFSIFCRRRISVPPKGIFFVAQRFCSLSSVTCSAGVCENDSTKLFTVSYLIHSCGLSPKAAASASKKLCFTAPEKPDAVLKLLREYGFTDAHIPKLVTKWPRVLLACPDKNLLPKLEFFRSIGVPILVLAQKLSTEPSVLMYSLKNSIVPSYQCLRRVFQSDESVVRLFFRGPRAFAMCGSKEVSSNISLLRGRGMTESSIVSMLITRRSLSIVNERLAEYVDRAVEMGFDLSKITFTQAIHVFDCSNELTLKSKRDCYKSCGWSESDIHAAFLKYPYCMNIREKKIMANMDFLVNKLGFEPAAIAQGPVILGLSLEKRIKPRCKVAVILKEKGLLKKRASVMSEFLKVKEEKFLKRYIVKYEKEIPDLLDIYRGKSSREAKQLQ